MCCFTAQHAAWRGKQYAAHQGVCNSTVVSATVVSGGLRPNVDAVPLSASAVRPSASPGSPVVQGHTVPAPSAGLCRRQTQSLEFVVEMGIDNCGEILFLREA